MGLVQRFLVFLALLASVVVSGPVSAQPAGSSHLRAKLVAQSDKPLAGGVVTLAIVFTPDPGWHGYWQNPGDAGLGARFEWALPQGVTIGEPLYPVPERLIVAGLMNHVYEHEFALLVQLKLPRGLDPGTRLPISAKGEWLACTKEICVPESGTLSTQLVVGNGEIAPERQQAFNKWWARMPRPLGSETVFQRDGERLRIAVPIPAQARVEDPWFYALTENALAYAEPQKVTRDGDRLVIETRAAGEVDRLKGVLAIGPDRGLAIEARPGSVPAGGVPVDQSVSAAGLGLASVLLAIGGAILGGLLLNIMPCVFPIISLKALSLARAGGDERAVRREAMAYTAGVVATCLALGGLLLGLRAAGQTIGWAFQLQNPIILFLLLLLSVAITLNLLGVFDIGGFGGGQHLAGQGGARGAFWTGALAAFVATPCTGPFMAAALGAALVLPAILGMAIFAGLGLGLALPFLALGFVPALRRRMPRPGPWMVRFRTWMALPMALTAVALFWLLWRQSGLSGMGIALAAALLLGGLLWLAGRPGSAYRLASLGGIAAVALIGSLVLPAPANRAIATGVHQSVAFDETALDRLRAEGKPVFLYFTADWCVTCKVNEKAAIEREDVARAFDRAGAAVMVGDWTNGDPEITRFLESHGRSGVPLYLWYPVGGKAKELPQLLTPGMLIGLTA
jgi:thiol:disulfide interchange protein